MTGSPRDAGTAPRPGIRQHRIVVPRADKIGKRVLVQHIDESFESVAEHAVDRRRALDAAR